MNRNAPKRAFDVTLKVKTKGKLVAAYYFEV